jgi:hypothetical protein
MLTAQRMTAEQLYNTLKNIKVGGTVCTYSLKKCEELVPLINEINLLKAEQNAVILAHSYVSPEIIYGRGLLSAQQRRDEFQGQENYFRRREVHGGDRADP